MSYLQVSDETGACVTHDVKNLLQSPLTSAMPRPSQGDPKFWYNCWSASCRRLRNV